MIGGSQKNTPTKSEGYYVWYVDIKWNIDIFLSSTFITPCRKKWTNNCKASVYVTDEILLGAHQIRNKRQASQDSW